MDDLSRKKPRQPGAEQAGAAGQEDGCHSPLSTGKPALSQPAIPADITRTST